jgi:ssDNA-binding Zn-finger/Zn-ribbon topoisomerase 1
MKITCDRCGFWLVMSRHHFEHWCYGTPYCPKCGEYMDENLEDEE